MSRKLIWVVLLIVAGLVFCSILLFKPTQSVRSSQSEPQGGSPAMMPRQDPTPATAPVSKAMCTLITTQAPDIHGLRLGLTTQQVLDLFPGSRDDAEVRAAAESQSAVGASSFLVRPEKYGVEKTFVGINHFTFNFLDKRLMTVRAGYSGPQWKNVDEFVKKFSEGKTLPQLEAWEAYTGLDTQLKTLTCDGFEISVFAGGEGGNLNYVQMKDLVAEKEAKDRRAKARKAAEKPTP
jgi:hypothetical protein